MVKFPETTHSFVHVWKDLFIGYKEAQSLNIALDVKQLSLVGSSRLSVLKRVLEELHTKEKSTSEISESSTSFFEFGASHFNNYLKRIRYLGSGGFGCVYMCENTLDQRLYAVKMIHLNKSPPSSRALREVEILSRMDDHFVVRYHQSWIATRSVEDSSGSAFSCKVDAGISFKDDSDISKADAGISFKDDPDISSKNGSDDLFILMEYCPRTLHQLLDSDDCKVDEGLAWHLFFQIAQVLTYTHSQQVIHRDLTPSNIFLHVNNDIKIGDFGLAEFVNHEHDEDTPRNGCKVGIPICIAPEIKQKEIFDEKADIYSLGVILFELLTSFSTGFERVKFLEKLEGIKFLDGWAANFPEQASLLRRLLSCTPTDRPSSIVLASEEFILDFRSMLKDAGATHFFEKAVCIIFDEGVLVSMSVHDAEIAQYSLGESEHRDSVVNATRKVFEQHLAWHLEIKVIKPLHKDAFLFSSAVKLSSQDGDIVGLSHKLHLPFVKWVAAEQVLFRRYEIASVYRRTSSGKIPLKFLQGDFDIVGGSSSHTEAEIVRIYWKRESSGSTGHGTVLAIGGRYDYHQIWERKHISPPSPLPGAVGTSLASETILQSLSTEQRISEAAAMKKYRDDLTAYEIDYDGQLVDDGDAEDEDEGGEGGEVGGEGGEVGGEGGEEGGEGAEVGGEGAEEGGEGAEGAKEGDEGAEVGGEGAEGDLIPIFFREDEGNLQLITFFSGADCEEMTDFYDVSAHVHEVTAAMGFNIGDNYYVDFEVQLNQQQVVQGYFQVPFSFEETLAHINRAVIVRFPDLVWGGGVGS